MKQIHISDLEKSVWCTTKRDNRQAKKEAVIMAPPAGKLEGVGEELQKMLRKNMDEAPQRRRVREAFKEIQLGIDHYLMKVFNGVLIDPINSIDVSMCACLYCPF